MPAENRTKIIKLRVTPEEHQRWNEEAAADSTTVSELVRRRMNTKVRVDLSDALLAPLFGETSELAPALGGEKDRGCSHGRRKNQWCPRCDD